MFQEVDEESCADAEERAGAGAAGVGGEERRRRPDVLDERLGRQFVEFRRRRARRAGEALRELSPPPAGAPTRAASEPDALHRDPDAPAPAPHT